MLTLITENLFVVNNPAVCKPDYNCSFTDDVILQTRSLIG